MNQAKKEEDEGGGSLEIGGRVRAKMRAQMARPYARLRGKHSRIFPDFERVVVFLGKGDARSHTHAVRSQFFSSPNN